MKPPHRSPRPLSPTARVPAAEPAFLLVCGLLTLLPVVFWRGALGPFEPVKLALVQLTALALLAVWPGPLSARPCNLLDLAVLAGCASALLSTAVSVCPRTSWQGAWESHAGLGTILPLAVIYFATRNACRGAPAARALVIAITVGALPSFGYAAIQVLGADPLNWSDLSHWQGWARPVSTLGHPNHLGALAALCVPLLLALLHADGKGRRERAVLGAALALASFTVIATLSRAAWLAAAVGGGASLAAAVRPRRAWLLGGLIALAATVTVGWHGPLGERVRRAAEAAPRLLVWQAAWDSFRDRPLLGNGPDTFALAFARHRPLAYAELEWGVTPNRAHNDLLHVLATQGALGAAAFLFLLAALALTGWQAFRTRVADRPLIVGAGASLLAWAVLGLFGFSVVTTAAVAAALAGVLAGLAREGLAEDHAPPATPRVIAGAAGLGWLVMLANLLLDSDGGRSAASLALLLLHAALIAAALLAARRLLPAPNSSLLPGAPPRTRWPLAAGAAAVAFFFVLRPLLAGCACQWGERQPPGPEPASLAWHQRAVRLAPGWPVYHANLAARAQEAAGLSPPGDQAAAHRRVATAAQRNAVALAPADPDLWANLARALHAQALAGEASAGEVAEAHGQALRRDPNNLVLLAEAARSAVRLGLLDRGRELANRGLALAPRFAPLHVEKANLALAASDLDAAERHLNDALAVEWYGDAEAIDRCWGLLSFVCAERGHHARAASLAAFVLERRPDWVTVRCLRAQSLERLGQTAAARSEYDVALRSAPTFAPALEGRDRLAPR